MHLADAFIQSDLQCIQVIHLLSVCVPWELNPQPFALLMQFSTTEPQEQVMTRSCSIYLSILPCLSILEFLNSLYQISNGIFVKKFNLCNCLLKMYIQNLSTRDRLYIGLPIFFIIFKHFTIIGYWF